MNQEQIEAEIAKLQPIVAALYEKVQDAEAAKKRALEAWHPSYCRLSKLQNTLETMTEGKVAA